MSLPELGVIEGFYGEPWSPADRLAQLEFLAQAGYRSYLYAPKGDPFLRKRWREPMPAQNREQLTRLAERAHALGLEFGVGLSPYELFRSFSEGDRARLAETIDLLDRLPIDHLAILFDDMKGDLAGLADIQVDILHWIAERAKARRLSLCPTYYSDDPVLDRVFGKRPERYLEELGRKLDPRIGLFWTGEEICSREISVGHLERVASLLGRKPLLWDNYPVNDGQRMCKFLHLRAFTGRPAAIAAHLSAHFVNPMNQTYLSRVPLLSLVMSYQQGGKYSYGEALRECAVDTLGPELGERIREDLLFFQDVGLDRLDDDQKRRLHETYAALDHPAAREVLRWLDGAYQVTREQVLTQ